ncbi:SRPBCC family protein [Sinorhizobium medicae]|uniref:SRPBCC family protein n=1 Tax=Sinorhizobium medicae TaxID=110321 RepID=UPI0003689163|nr:SRPBCC domain-containing protein [Sinorhizobium medicae]
MNKVNPREQARHLVFEYELGAPPDMVWQAISVPELVDRWWPERELAGTEPVSTAPGQEICYRMRDDEPPFLESLVTFQIRPNADGGTILRIVHGLEDERLGPPAANSNQPWLMRAA